jgi:hypothetical protein
MGIKAAERVSTEVPSGPMAPHLPAVSRCSVRAQGCRASAGGCAAVNETTPSQRPLPAAGAPSKIDGFTGHAERGIATMLHSLYALACTLSLTVVCVQRAMRPSERPSHLGKAKAAVLKGNRVLPLGEGPRPSPPVPSIYEWQIQQKRAAGNR